MIRNRGVGREWGEGGGGRQLLTGWVEFFQKYSKTVGCNFQKFWISQVLYFAILIII